MAEHTVRFEPAGDAVQVPTGTLLSEAASQAGIEINQPCGGQGRCGRCLVQVPDQQDGLRRRSELRLSSADIEQGYTLACQSLVEGSLEVFVPPQEKIERRLTTDRTVGEVQVPPGYDPVSVQTIQRLGYSLNPPSMDDQTDDWSRLRTALRQQYDIQQLHVSLPLLRRLGSLMRAGEWQGTAILETGEEPGTTHRLVGLQPGQSPEETPLHGIAVDIGTTTVTLWLVDLISGNVLAQVAEYNQQISRGEDVISRIIFASKNNGAEILQSLVLETINGLVDKACLQTRSEPHSIYKVTISGNSTMMHLLLGVPAESIRLSPFVTAANQPPPMRASEVGLAVNPEAVVDCLPGVASYVGADITAGVLAAGVDDSEQISLFLDVGTNGEMVLGSRDWLVTCACSAGPAFEGAGVGDGMRATRGAIEEVWINQQTCEPTFRVIGGVKPQGLCGSGLISLLAELFLTGVLDKGGHLNQDLPTERVRVGEHGPEYVIAWAAESGHGRDITLTHVDIDNLLRAKAAIYAGFTVLSESVGVPLESAEQVLVGGSFGKYINVEKAIQIGLLPDLPWEQFSFLGNTSVRGAYLALLDRNSRQRIQDIAGRMTYIELSADNSFYDAFTSALFLPHTDMSRFPSIAAELDKLQAAPAEA